MLLTEDKLKQFIREEAKKYLENLETQHHPYRILLMSDVPVLFPEGYEEEAINTYNIMMEREGLKSISQELAEIIKEKDPTAEIPTELIDISPGEE